VSEAPEQIVRLIDTKTGEHQDFDFCPDCVEKEQLLQRFERDLRVEKAKVSRLEGRKRQADEESKRWAEAEQVFTWWALATGHEGSDFNHDRFNQIAPRLKERKFGPVGILKGIAGAAFDAGERPMPNGRVERYDDIELVCRASHKLENFQERVPGGPDSETWKRWLLDRIESNLTNKEDTDG
jgi:hypothetical protein